MREAVYHERVVSDLEKRLESANNRIEVLESQNVNGSEILFHAP
jgi:chaperonin cofactor prefoldin